MNEPALQRLGDAIERASPFYTARLRAAGITSRDTLAAGWPRLAPTRRDELVADQLAHLPYGSRRAPGAEPPVRAGKSGSGDELLALTWTKADLACERTAGVRCLQQAGIRPGMRVANVLPGALFTPGSLLLGDVVDDLGALDVPLGEVSDQRTAEAAWSLLRRVAVHALVLRPRDAEILWAHAPTGETAPFEVVVWLHFAAASPAPAPGFAARHAHWLGVPEAACFAALAADDVSFRADDDVWVEIVDERGNAAAVGNLLLTPLGRDEIVLRYDSGLLAERIDSGAAGSVARFRLL